MIEPNLTLQDAKVKAAIERVFRSLPIGGDSTPVMKTIGRIIKTGTQLRHREEETPEGVAWIPSQRALEEGGVTLRLTSRLRNSYSFLADHASVRIGTNVIYAGIHHHGGQAGRKSKRVRIIARPALGASDADKLEIVGAMNDYLGGAWNR